MPLHSSRAGSETVIYEEVGIREQTNHALPYGCIDLLSFAQTGKGSYLMLHCCMDGSKAVRKCNQMTPTTVKSPNTYQNPGSNRKTVVELLSLSQVLLHNNPDMECLIMLKLKYAEIASPRIFTLKIRYFNQNKFRYFIELYQFYH